MKNAIVDNNLIFAQPFKNRFVNMYNDTIKALDVFTTAEVVAKITKTAVKTACGSATWWGIHQPKEPNNLKKLLSE